MQTVHALSSRYFLMIPAAVLLLVSLWVAVICPSTAGHGRVGPTGLSTSTTPPDLEYASSNGAHNSVSRDTDNTARSSKGARKLSTTGNPSSRQLAAGQQPNFIVILTDDQGWDDIGMNNPYVQTPNLDKFIKQGVLFDNFYTSPQCAQSRASLLTGRHHPKTGTMLVYGGYDTFHKGETTIAGFMSAAGYVTAHVGKWHGINIQGYAPTDVGFQHSWNTYNSIFQCLKNLNGAYAASSAESAFGRSAAGFDSTARVQGSRPDTTEGYLMGKTVEFLKSWREANPPRSRKPFFLFYASHAIHEVPQRPNGSLKAYPRGFLGRLLKDPMYKDIPFPVLDAWANLMYLDQQLGRLFNELEQGSVASNTYVFILADNGASFEPNERRSEITDWRMPSNMQGYKSSLYEGGIRSFLAVKGPGVPSTTTDSTLLHVTDILPTILQLAGVSESSADHLPLDGISFDNLLRSPEADRVDRGGSPSREGSALATRQQRDRYIVEMSAACWDADAVPVLTRDRQVDRPQRLLDYKEGGLLNSVFGARPWFPPGVELPPKYKPGFELCMAVRYKTFKWLGITGKVYRLMNGSHVELPGNELTGARGRQLAGQMSDAAQRWFSSLVAEPHSFTKRAYYLGLNSWSVSNIEAVGAHERTPGNIKLFANGATGFRDIGDRMCFRVEVLEESTHDVVMLYTPYLGVRGTFKIALGPYSSIRDGSAPSIVAKFPGSKEVMRGYTMGQLRNIPKSNKAAPTELCLELVRSTSPGLPVYKHLAAIRMIRRWDLEHNNTTTTTGFSLPHSSVMDVAEAVAPGEVPTATAAPEPVWSAEKEGSAGLQGLEFWSAVRVACGWPQGQVIMDHMYSPLDAEGIEHCDECQPMV